MADGVTTQSSTLATIPSGTEIATDDAGADGHVQIVKLAISTDGSATAIPATSTAGMRVNLHDGTDALAINADGSINISGSVTASAADLLRIQVTPTVSAGVAYGLKEAIGGLLTFANAASSSGGSGVVRSVGIVDKDGERADIDIVFFRASIAAPTDNTSFDPTDTELLDYVGHASIGTGFYSNFNDNAAAFVACDVPYDLSGTDLYGVLVAQSTPTYTATTDIVVTIHVERF